MTHQRKVIRDEVVRRLVGQTPAGSRVSAARVDPYRNAELPAISVYTPSDAKDEGNTTAQVLSRDQELEVVVWVVHSDTSPAVDQLDAIAERVEAVMDADLFLGGAAGRDGLVLQSTETAIVTEMNGKQIDPYLGLMKMTYSIPYLTDRETVTATDDFKRSGTTTPVDGQPVDAAMQDLITVGT